MWRGCTAAEVLRLQGQQGAVPGHGEAHPGRDLKPAHRDGPGRLQPRPVHARHPQDVARRHHRAHGHDGLCPQRFQDLGEAGPADPHPGGPGIRVPGDGHHPDSLGQPLGGARADEDGVVPRGQIVQQVPADPLDTSAPVNLREDDGDLRTAHARPRLTGLGPPAVVVVGQFVRTTTTRA